MKILHFDETKAKESMVQVKGYLWHIVLELGECEGFLGAINRRVVTEDDIDSVESALRHLDYLTTSLRSATNDLTVRLNRVKNQATAE